MPIAPSAPENELLLASRVVAPGLRQNELAVPAIHCGACVARIERVLGGLPGVERARVNLSTKRVTVAWRGETPPPLAATLGDAGFDVHLHDATVGGEPKDEGLRELVRALAVAGFASTNIMMLSVGIWSGADEGTRDLFHWLSAAIAVPGIFYGGWVFFRSAGRALRHGRTNMDVPISIGVLLAFAMSLYETLHHGPHAYFDAAVGLVFFLLVGRTLDHLMREKARTAVKGLARLAARGATVIEADGARRYLAVNDLRRGMILALAAGDRVPVDGRIVSGRSETDMSLVSGESLPRPVEAGSELQAGTLNLTAPITIVATAAAADSFLAEMTRLMEAAETGRAAYRRIADRAARLYAPAVHLTALLAFAGWMAVSGDLHRAAIVAVAVLIVTCPCALGLAVPLVQVVAARRLFERGIMLKDGGALERLAEADHVVFDKTGTLTTGLPRLAGAAAIPPGLFAIAATMAAQSRHPCSHAIAAAAIAHGVTTIAVSDLGEEPGAGLEGRIGGKSYRLGQPHWALSDRAAADAMAGSAAVLSEEGRLLARFDVEHELRPGVREAVAVLLGKGIAVEILSGDREDAVRRLAETLGVPYRAGLSPADKVAHIAARTAQGRKVLMVGDGLNDTPALAAAYVSMAPASAADIGRNAADLVFLRDSLLAVPQVLEVACEAKALVRQNFILAVVYNVLAVPVAVLGLVTPLLAAIAMSASSISVVANSLRLGWHPRKRPAAEVPRGRDTAVLGPVAGAGT